MSMIKADMLSVPGANIHYEVRGAGPVLLMIHGGCGDADVFLEVADHLADQYTVVTYDRRGHSRSKLTNPAEEYRIETHSDDAHRLLAALTDEPAYIFGSSSGAVIGLDLTMRYPGQVHALIPHEPPLLDLLHGDERSQARTIMEDLIADHRKLGLFPAFFKFTSSIGLQDDDGPSSPPSDEQKERMIANMEYFMANEAPGVLGYAFNLEQLQTALSHSAAQVRPAVGSTSRNYFPARSAEGLAERLGVDIAEFPENHIGYQVQPKPFAERLKEVLSSLW
ncbi:alpha/beta hydrolase [Paenibacillus sp. XY044]|uniref:alpha/beta hydrolase n=1 Tax=Paenibacillus sp. XY044 TaxID=2026089 RepID=UPI000B99566F|nr:alpha/beta fold hydrolase [Paenibacillus sp. XY044]OZB94209.1 alpha/beta hydrolase [Paenibacillus sp. XY044]